MIRASPDGRTVDVATLKEHVARFKQKTTLADARTLAYTSSILAGLYFYNGFRETGPDKTLRNAYYFLGFNFAVGGGLGFYRMLTFGTGSAAVTMSVLPFPSIAYDF